jgi:hypothetical protein
MNIARDLWTQGRIPGFGQGDASKQSKEREEVGKGKGEEARLSNRTG